MIDTGLLLTIGLVLLVPTVAQRWLPLDRLDPQASFTDMVGGSALIGLLVSRFTHLAIETPRSLASISDVIIVRSGVEFWAGVAAAFAVVAVNARRSHRPVVERLATLMPLSMIAYASFEATCVIRDGCFGPIAPIGLRPRGLQVTMFPVGLIIAVAVAGAAILVHAMRTRLRAGVRTLGAVAGVAVPRAVGSIWLPRVGPGLTRQHVESVAIAVAAVVGIAVVLLTSSEPAVEP